MPTIRVEHDVFEGLKSLAEPFTDTPNTVIRRLLEKQGVQFGKNKQVVPEREVKVGEARLTPQPIYQEFLLYILANEFNGRTSKSQATNSVIGLMKSKGFIRSADLERVKTGETKAENTIAWGRNRLKDSGLIRDDSPRGVWELTDSGREKAKGIILPSQKVE